MLNINGYKHPHLTCHIKVQAAPETQAPQRDGQSHAKALWWPPQ